MSPKPESKDEAFAPTETKEVHSPGSGRTDGKEPIPDEEDVGAQAREKAAHVVGELSEFPEGTHKVVKIGGRQIGVFNIGGKFYGLPNVCPHQTGPLCEAKFLTGTLVQNSETNWQTEWIRDGEIVICPWHGLEYEVPTGQCLAFPGIRLRNYEVFVEGGQVMVKA